MIHKAFAANRASSSERARKFTEKQLVCDEVHFVNHSNQPNEDENQTWRDFCRLKCDPKLHETSAENNTRSASRYYRLTPELLLTPLCVFSC